MRPNRSRDVPESSEVVEEHGEKEEEVAAKAAEASETVKESRSGLDDELELLKKKLAEAEARTESYVNRLKYLQADFDNYRKQMNRSLSEISNLERERIILKFLSVKDDLERALKVAEEAGEASSIREGLVMILKNMNGVLTGEGVEEVEAMGRLLDPDKHEAVGSIERSDCEENMVVAELRKGYVLNGRVIRPSMVKVARKTKVFEDAGESREV